jgi:CubicO group peptidase (beta-lactamase class C family)
MTSGLSESRPKIPFVDYYARGSAETVESLVVRATTEIVGNYAGPRRYRIPGRVHAYLYYTNSAALSLVLRRATGEPVAAFAKRELFQPLGLSIDDRSDSMGEPLLGGWFRGGCDDVAKLVQLYLNKGVWDGRRIVSGDFVRDALSPQVTCGECPANGENMAFMNGAYGLHWWINAAAPITVAPPARVNMSPRQRIAAGPTFPNLPTNTFYALGICNQIGAGIPGQKIVVVVLRKGCDDPAQRAAYEFDWRPAATFMEELGRAIQ